MTRSQAERLARRFGLHRSTIYRYRARLDDIGTATAIAGHKRGWKSFASRLSLRQEEAVEQAIKLMRRKAGPLRVVDLVEEVSALCRLQQIACPSRPAIDLRLKRTSGVKVRRRGVATPGNADPRISPGTFGVEHALDVVQIDHTPMDTRAQKIRKSAGTTTAVQYMIGHTRRSGVRNHSQFIRSYSQLFRSSTPGALHNNDRITVMQADKN
jgi:hypothetical protein